MVFPIILYLSGHHKKFQPSSLCGMPPAPGPSIKKLRALSFLQLLKFEKAKCPYFCDLWPSSRDMTTSSFKARVVRFKLSSEEGIANISFPGPQIKKRKDNLIF